jgi:CheY-like chemotaxis protein
MTNLTWPDCSPDALRAVGYKTKAFEDPFSAIEEIGAKHSEYSLVLTDWRMPKMNGLQLAKKIDEIDKEIKIMLMSAYDMEEDQLKEAKMSDYIRKPIHMNQIIESVKKQLSYIETPATLA